MLGYEARPQFVPFHTRRQRWAVVVAHRRAGKTVACILDLIDAALRCDKADARFAYIAPFYAQAKDVAWNYLKRFTAPIPGVQYHEAELRCTLPGNRTIRLYGADNYDRLRGVYFDGVVLDEHADMDPRAWPEVIRPALSDRKGWAVFIGTPKGHNAFYDVYRTACNDNDWLALILRASETGLVDESELEDARRSMTEEQYKQEYECDFEAAIVGAFYGKDITQARDQGRISRVAVERGVPVDVSWDLGVRDATALWFWQRVGREIRAVDYYESAGVGLDHYAKIMRERDYLYGEQVVPHDIEQTELGSGRTRLETLRSLGFARVKIIPKMNPMERVNAMRMLFPRIWFDAEKCERGIEALAQYRQEFDQKLKAFKPTPLHDWTSHAADSAGHYAVAHRDLYIPLAVNDRYARKRKPQAGWMAA